MMRQWRTVVEVAALGTVAMSLPLFAMFASIPVFNFFGSWGICLGFPNSLTMSIGIVLPFAAAFYYGYRRKLHLSFVAVLIGWILGWEGYSLLTRLTLLRGVRPQHHAPPILWD